MKLCKKCDIFKDLTEFHKNKNEIDGRSFSCKDCRKQDSRKRYSEKREQLIQYQKEYRKQNSSIIALKKKVYQARRKDEVNSYYRKYHELKKIDPMYLLPKKIRGRINKALRNGYKVGSAVEDLGCSIEFLISYLESKFQNGMTWENYGVHGWHIDHIIPLSSFDLTDLNQFKQAVHYTNLQPLWAKDNMTKGAKIYASTSVS